MNRALYENLTYQCEAFVAGMWIYYAFTGAITLSIGMAIVTTIVMSILFEINRRIWGRP